MTQGIAQDNARMTKGNTQGNARMTQERPVMSRVTTNCIRTDHDAPLNLFARRFGPLFKVDRVLAGGILFRQLKLTPSTKVDAVN
jgi:hypothetical protein